MESLSIWHWFIILFTLWLFLFPVARIVGRAGHSRLWVVAMLIPFVNLIALWVFAYCRWPAFGRGQR